jgi:fatty acid/phospholipid biosynthesis enzyme
LLGVKGVCFITHGSSNANAIKNAIRVAAEFAEHPINTEIERTLTGIRAARAARNRIEDVASNIPTVVPV